MDAKTIMKVLAEKCELKELLAQSKHGEAAAEKCKTCARYESIAYYCNTYPCGECRHRVRDRYKPNGESEGK